MIVARFRAVSTRTAAAAAAATAPATATATATRLATTRTRCCRSSLAELSSLRSSSSTSTRSCHVFSSTGVSARVGGNQRYYSLTTPTFSSSQPVASDNDLAAATTTTTTSVLPDEEYYDGHLVADHLEYLDDMMEKTLDMQTAMDALEDTYHKKKETLYKSDNVKWMDSTEIDALFVQSAQQKQILREKMMALKELVEEAKKKAVVSAKYRGVDGPDGISDDMIQNDMDAVSNIIDYASTHENKQAIDAMHNQQAAKK